MVELRGRIKFSFFLVAAFSLAGVLGFSPTFSLCCASAPSAGGSAAREDRKHRMQKTRNNDAQILCIPISPKEEGSIMESASLGIVTRSAYADQRSVRRSV